MPRAATLAAAANLLLVHDIVLRRAGSNLSSQDCYIDCTPQGAEAVIGLIPDGGMMASNRGVAVYWKTTADVERGDRFAHDGVQYRVAYVAPTAKHYAGNGYVMCWAEAEQV